MPSLQRRSVQVLKNIYIYIVIVQLPKHLTIQLLQSPAPSTTQTTLWRGGVNQSLSFLPTQKNSYPSISPSFTDVNLVNNRQQSIHEILIYLQAYVQFFVFKQGILNHLHLDSTHYIEQNAIFLEHKESTKNITALDYAIDFNLCLHHGPVRREFAQGREQKLQRQLSNYLPGLELTSWSQSMTKEAKQQSMSWASTVTQRFYPARPPLKFNNAVLKYNIVVSTQQAYRYVLRTSHMVHQKAGSKQNALLYLAAES